MELRNPSNTVRVSSITCNEKNNQTLVYAVFILYINTIMVHLYISYAGFTIPKKMVKLLKISVKRASACLFCFFFFEGK